MFHDVLSPPAAALSRRNALLISCAIAALVIAVLGSIFWVGYQGADDSAYIDGALDWYRHFPFVGGSHWDLRYPVILAIDAGFWLFGIREFSVGVVMLAYLFGLVAISIWMLQRWFGLAESLVFIVLFCAMPGIIVVATYANADVTEVFFVAFSLACYCTAFESRHRRWLLICAGFAAGLGFATRETTIGLIAAYGLLFLVRPGIKRSEYVLIGLGFAAVIFLEMAYFQFEVGNPFWRFTLDVHHDSVDRSTVLGPGQVLDNQGNLGGWMSAILIFLVSQKYALIFYAMLGAIPLFLRRAWNQVQLAFLFAAGALFIGWAGHVLLNVWLLYLVPRYFVATAWVAALFAAIGLVQLWNGRPRLAGFIAILMLIADALCLYVENTEPIQASRAAINVTLQRHEPVYTDALTRYRGRFLAQTLGVGDQIMVGNPKPGSLYVLSRENRTQCRLRNCDADRANLNEIGHWKEIERIVPQPRVIGKLLDSLKLTQLIPGDIRRKLVEPNPGVVVYRVE